MATKIIRWSTALGWLVAVLLSSVYGAAFVVYSIMGWFF